MATTDELFWVFAGSILPKAVALRELDLTAPQRARVREAASQDIRKVTDLTTPLVSRAAKKEADRLGVDLCAQGWHDQHKFDLGRNTFHFEHVVTFSDAVKACSACVSRSEIVAVLVELQVAWILKAENQELDLLGYRKHREEARTAYHKAGIELILCHGGPS